MIRSKANPRFRNRFKNRRIRVQETFVDNIVVQNGKTKIAILYPNTYYLGMSNLGFQGIYYSFLQRPEFHVNRYFYDSESKHKVFSPENEFSLSQAKVILISQSYENDFFLLIQMFLANQIEPLAQKRQLPQFPMIGVGGAFPNSNSQVFLSLADIIFKGEFENYIEELFVLFLEYFESKEQWIALASSRIQKYIEYEGLGKFEENSKKWVVLKESPLLQKVLKVPNYTHILTKETSFSNNFLVEITRGCRFRCKFCNVPGLYGNLRTFQKEELFRVFDLGLRKTKKLGLVSALTTQYPDLKELIYYVNERGGKVSFSSLRVEQVDDDLLGLIRKNDQNILTIAPETASERLKKKIRKSIKTETVFKLVEKAIGLGFKKLKFYFIIGYVEEDEEDLDDLIRFVKGVRQIALGYAKELKTMPSIILGVNQLIPKPKTPFSEEAFLDYKSMKSRVRYLKKNILSLGNIQMRLDSYQENYLQWRLTHASKDLGIQIIEWIKQGLIKDLYSLLLKERSVS